MMYRIESGGHRDMPSRYRMYCTPSQTTPGIHTTDFEICSVLEQNVNPPSSRLYE